MGRSAARCWTWQLWHSWARSNCACLQETSQDGAFLRIETFLPGQMGGVIRGKWKVTCLGKWNHGSFFRERINNYWKRTLTSWPARIDSTWRPCRELQGGLPLLCFHLSVGMDLLLTQLLLGVISASVSISNRNPLVHPVAYWCNRYFGPSWVHFGGWIEVRTISHNRPAQNQVRQTPWHRCRLLGIEAWGALQAPPEEYRSFFKEVPAPRFLRLPGMAHNHVHPIKHILA